MALTKEEKAKRKAEREAEQEVCEAEFPGVHYYARKGEVQLILEHGGGPSYGLRLRTNNVAQFKQDRGFAEWSSTTVSLENIEYVARLIEGLTARLNGLIRDANEAIEGIPVRETVNKAGLQS